MSVPTRSLRNVAFAGHGSTGKTTLVEELLAAGGVIPKAERVETGKTVSDFTEEEISRKISIHTSLTHVTWKDCKINILDTPGSADFVGEVVRGIPRGGKRRARGGRGRGRPDRDHQAVAAPDRAFPAPLRLREQDGEGTRRLLPLRGRPCGEVQGELRPRHHSHGRRSGLQGRHRPRRPEGLRGRQGNGRPRRHENRGGKRPAEAR